MDDAARARDAAREALADIEPESLRGRIDERLDEASMTPAALVFVSARAIDPDLAASAVADRAAGVQLIYEGLRLTRQLAADEPWAGVDEGSIPADVDVLAADVLVARGFYLLARTDAAGRAVETVRSFGHDQTLRRGSGDAPARPDRDLEADVFGLAATAGTTAAGTPPPAALLEYVADIARGYDGDLPPAALALGDGVDDRVASVATGGAVPSPDS